MVLAAGTARPLWSTRKRVSEGKLREGGSEGMCYAVIALLMLAVRRQPDGGRKTYELWRCCECL